MMTRKRKIESMNSISSQTSNASGLASTQVAESSTPDLASAPVSLSSPPNLASAPVSDSEVIQIPDSEASQVTQNKPPSKKHTSPVWNEFEKVKINGVWRAICSHCKKDLKAESTSGTKHLLNHLQKHCPKRKLADKRQKTMGFKETTDGKLMIKTFTFNQDTSREDLAKAICLHEYPLSIVEHIGFRNFVHGLQPNFQMPKSRNTVKSDILKLYQSEKAKLNTTFEKLQSRISITTDMWTSRQKKGYMAVTAHFIDEHWYMNDVLIGFIYVPSPHTNEVLCDALMECLLDWNIERKISSITVDNCTTNNAMIRGMLDKLSESNSLMLGGKLIHMRCNAHILNLIVKDGLEVIENSTETIRDNVSYWSASQSRVKKIEKARRETKVECAKKLALDCKTRWNSTFLMLETAISFRDVFLRLRRRERQSINVPSEEEWDLAKEICGRLKLFHSITETFSGTQYPTANLLFPKICEVKLALSSWCKSPCDTIQSLATNMMNKFDDYWGECHLIAGIAVVLDPRYKLKFVDYILEKIYGSKKNQYIDPIKDACYDLISEYQNKSKSDNEVGQRSSSSGMTKSVPEWDVFSDYDVMVNDQAQFRTVKSELDHYLEEKVLPRSNDFDILSWWKANGGKYPTLQLIARDILAIPASTVASESAFSTSGRIVTPHRSRLGTEILEALMLTQDWLWNDLEEDDLSSKEKSTICNEESDELDEPQESVG